MSKSLVAMVGLLAFFAAACASRQEAVSSPEEPPADRGGVLVAQLLQRDAAPYRKVRARFTITEAGEQPKAYELETWRRQREGETATLTQIVRPAEDSDLASLAVESPGKPTVITSYIATRGEFRESGTNRMFFGGLTAGELLGEWQKFSYRLIGERAAGDVNVDEVEGRLRPGQTGVVAKMTVLFRREDGFPVELRLYDASDKHLRTYRVTEIRSDSRGPYAARTEVDNHLHGSMTVIEVLGREFPDAADDAIFTRERLRQIGVGRTK